MLEHCRQRQGLYRPAEGREILRNLASQNPILQELHKTFDSDIEPKQAWTDIARLALYKIPAANFGPGQAAQAHQKGESIEKKGLEECYQIFHKFIYG